MSAVVDSSGPLVGEGPASSAGDSHSLLKLHSPLLTRIGLGLVSLSVLCGLGTYMILTGLTPIQPGREYIVALLAVNLVLVSLMAGLIGWQVVALLRARARKISGAGLHIRMVALLAVFAAVPALIVALFASVTLNRGLDAWFSERTRSIVDTAEQVARSYLDEQADVARADVAFVAADLNQQGTLFADDRPAFIRRVATHAAFRSLSGAFVINPASKQVLASATANPSVEFRPPDEAAVTEAESGAVVLRGPGDGNVIRALVKLNDLNGLYFYAYRLVNPAVVEQLAKAKAEKDEYDRLLAQRAGVQVTFALMYAGVAFIFLLAAIWLGLWFADRLVRPIVQLVDASRRVSGGDLDAKVSVLGSTGDLQTLGHTFNRMTEQVKTQRDALMAASQDAEARRRFIETVLAGVSAGVIGLDKAGRVTLTNRSAVALLGSKLADLGGKPLREAVPEMAEILEKAMARASGIAEGHVAKRVGTQDRSFIVRVSTEQSSEHDHGYVVTFDDTTELAAAQRNSAWADIARRIAHEIKNPLTPIQLSAERLKRKYGKEIRSDRQVFDQCTDTIIRQVGDIGRMVDEFSAFARMPKASPERGELTAVVREALVLQRVSADDIGFDIELPEQGLELDFDRRLVTQAITNVVKNARESIEARLQGRPQPPGAIRIRLTVDRERAVADLAVADNGLGLPKENRHRLTEPYMTTREKGTGLGLAIVQRIMEEHGGQLVLDDAPADFDDGIGAQVTLRFPIDGMTAGPAADEV